MKKWLGGWWLSVGFLLAFVGSVTAQSSVPSAPINSIYVQDYAKVLSDETKNKINNLGKNLKSISNAQIVVVTIDNLLDSTPEDYALKIIRQWGIGDKKLNNGILLLVITSEHRSRIEVGYGLEGILPDAKVGQIQDEQLIPYLKIGDYDRGIWNTYQVLVNTTAKEYNTTVNNIDENSNKSHSNDHEVSLQWWVKIIIFFILIILIIIDNIIFGGFFTGLILGILLMIMGRKNDDNSDNNDGFGGGSSGGGGSERDW